MSEDRARGIDANRHPWTRWFFGLRPFIQFLVVLGAAGSVLGGAFGLGWVAKERLTQAETVIPRITKLEAQVIEARIRQRVEGLEARMDTVHKAVARQEESLRELARGVERGNARLDRIICLMEVQQGTRRPLECR